MGSPALVATFWVFAGLAALYFTTRHYRKQLTLQESRLASQRLREDFLSAILRAQPSEENFVRLVEDFLPRFFPGSQILVWSFLEQLIWSNQE